MIVVDYQDKMMKIRQVDVDLDRFHDPVHEIDMEIDIGLRNASDHNTSVRQPDVIATGRN